MFPQQITRSNDPCPLPPQFSELILPITLHNKILQIRILYNIFLQLNRNKPFCVHYHTIQLKPLMNVQPSTFTINRIHTNPQTHPTTSRTLSRPPSPLFPNNRLSCNLSSKKINNIPQPSTVSHTQSNTLRMISLSTSQIPKIPSTTIRTNSYNYTTNTLSTLNTQNTQNIPSSSNVNYRTIPSSTLPLTKVSNPTYKNSSACVSEPKKPFDCSGQTTHPKNIYSTLKHKLHFHWVYNPQLNLNINCGTLDVWLSYNAL